MNHIIFRLCKLDKRRSRPPAAGIQSLGCSLQDTLTAAVPVRSVMYIIAQCMQGSQQQSSTYTTVLRTRPEAVLHQPGRWVEASLLVHPKPYIQNPKP